MTRSSTLTDALAEFGLSTCGKSCTYCPAGDALTGGVCRCLRDAGNVALQLAYVARRLAAQVDQARAEVALVAAERTKIDKAKRRGLAALDLAEHGRACCRGAPRNDEDCDCKLSELRAILEAL